MIDKLLSNMDKFFDPGIKVDGVPLQEKNYFVLTRHRPVNVDEEQKLKDMMQAVRDNTGGLPIIFPVHPRTAF